MARLAESSVVVALRDWQWETAIMEGRRPGPFLNLSGNTDKKLGDVKFSENDRLFLIEAKATENEIKEEWDRGERPRKHAHRMLRALIESYGGNENERDANLIRSSLLAHHFLYSYTTKRRSDIVFEPYIIATQCLEGFKENKDNKEPETPKREKENVESLAKGLLHVSKFKLFDTKKKKHTHFAIPQKFYNKTVTMSYENDAAFELGLTLPKFQEYINYLCGDKDEDIEALIKCLDGKLIAFSGKTSELNKFVQTFKTSKKHYPQPSRARKDHDQ
ncbi:hypothetical protein KV692_04070 [Xanthomonas euvesicatoria pv. physalidis]|uniref:hypothetical protein n=1 Tax=Xanthomonas euvesicatoria TaxID=456327 RepID=UPI001C463896|nr:hypothetical protein [Xanthomonas euvesicatoria]MBV6687073.1 hypothetical protein [Xanthomonas euvesicatoria pv. physalidis]MBV6799062.1 hypothetical protein [Xanthomonas campestris pv. obscurae]